MNFSKTALAFLTLFQGKSALVKAAEAKRALQSGCGGADLITLEFKPNCYGDELSFEILQNNEQFDSDSGFSDDQTYLYEWCVDPLLGCVDFFFDDSYGDGMECSWGSDDGYFTLSLNGNEVFSESGNWGFSSYYAFPCGAFGGDDYDYFYYYNPFIDMCEEEGDVGTYVYLELGSYPWEISWELTDTTNGDLVASKDYGDLMLDYDYYYYYGDGDYFFWTGNFFAQFDWYNGTNTTDDWTWSMWDYDYFYSYSYWGWGDYDYGYGYGYGYILYPAAFAYHEICYPPACLELTVSDNVYGDGLDYFGGGYGYYLVVNEGQYVALEDGDFGDGSTVATFCTDTAAPTEAPVESAGSEDLTEDPIGYIFALLEELFKALLAIFGR